MKISLLPFLLPSLYLLLFTLSILTTAVLGISVVRSGLSYEYDIDELSHTQYTYLLGSGYKPYTSFYMIFTPFFYWFQLPIYKIGGFNFDSIERMRMVMTVLFILRLAVTFLLIRKIFGKYIALLFMPLILLDPFSTFSAMQIRPDNLMMGFFSLGLLVLSSALEKSLRLLFLLSGVLFSLSLAILIKILPGIVILVWVFAIYCYLKKSWRNFFFFLLGFPIPWIFLFIYFSLQGNLIDFIQSIFIFAFLNNLSVISSPPLSFFYSRANAILFGTSEMQLPWVYVHFLPLLTIAGTLITIYSLYSHRKNISSPEFLKIVLIALLCVFAIWVFTVPGAYLQYFLPLSWIMAIFASVFLVIFFTWLRKKSLKGFFLAVLPCLCLFIFFAKESVEANLARAEITSEKTIAYNKSLWMIIPPSEATFPNMLFRPTGYPLIYGSFIGDTHPYVLKHWGKVEDSLEKKKVKYIFKSDYLWKYLEPGTKEYIDAHYIPSEMPGVLIRKD